MNSITPPKFKLLTAIKILIFCINTSGCASFKGEEVQPAKNIEIQNRNEKPSVQIDVKNYFGKPSYAFSQPIADKNNKLALRIKSIIEKANLFSRISTTEDPQETYDYKIDLSIYLYNNSNTAMFAGLITAFSAAIIPVGGTDHYEIKAAVTNMHSSKKKEFFNKDHITTWIGIWFLPMTSHSPEKIKDEVIENQIKDILNKMIDDEAIASQDYPN